MTFDKFHNALRVLRSIDLHEITAAGLYMPQDEWVSFRDNPYRWFIMAELKDAAVVWKIVEERNK